MLLVAAAASTAPWWGSGLFTLLGGALGAAVTQVFNVWNSQRKDQAERGEAERAMRRESLVEFLTAGHDYLRPGPDPESKQSYLYASFVRLGLVLSGKLLDKAERYMEAAQAVVDFERF